MLQAYTDATAAEIDNAMQKANEAAEVYKQVSLQQRAAFMKAIVTRLNNAGDNLLEVAMQETHLSKPRLQSEKDRTVFQLNSYADACVRGEWMNISIDEADTARKPPKPDIRKTMVPLGPVVVFGASNFPFAYSTAGGDTACAFAAGCPVIVKAHPAHANTSQMVADIISQAAEECNMPEGIFQHIHGANIESGKQLVMHPFTKAVGFTGSLNGGRQLFDWGNQRKFPIPVFAEMGSINPVFLLPEKLKSSYAEIAEMYAVSITLSVGQFCTNPGLMIGIKSDALLKFISSLTGKMQQAPAAEMLHPGIARAYQERKQRALDQKEVHCVSQSDAEAKENYGVPTFATASAQNFLQNPILHEEVFGPYSLLIQCENTTEMLAVANAIEGQLTATVMATNEDINTNKQLMQSIKNICGRLIFNGVPTGVEVCQAMNHGGPYPATTDSRFTSVGSDGIKRFTATAVLSKLSGRPSS